MINSLNIRRALAAVAGLFAAFVFFGSCCSKDNGSSLLVMSYNVRNSHANDGDNAWDIRKTATKAMIDSQKPDIIGIQEAYPEQEGYIVAECPAYKAFGVGRNDGAEDGERMSIVYNSEVLSMEQGGTWWLSETPDVPSVGWDAKYPRTATWALMKDKRNGSTFYFVNTHLDHKGANARRNGLLMIVNKIKAMNADVPLILTGDFNVEPGDSCLVDVDSLMISARVAAKVTTDTPSFNGFNKEGRQKTIDYIYYYGFGEAESFSVLDQDFDGKPFISDHYPILAILRK